MSRRDELLLHAGGEAVRVYGTVYRKTARGEDNGYTHSRSSVAQFTGTTVIRTAASGVPRIEWLDTDSDGVRETPALLLEGARTNFVTDSAVEDATWSGTTGNRTINQTSPTGALDAVLLTDGSTSAFRELTHALTTSTGTPRIVSAYVKRSSTGARPEIKLSGSTAAVSRGAAKVTWGSTGGISSISYSGGAAAITGSSVGENAGDGWWRVPFKASTSLVAGNGHELQLFPDALSQAATGASYFWHPQIEVGAFHSSPIATTTGSETRAADTFYLPFTYPPQAMTIYAKWRENGTAQLANFTRVWHIGSSGNTDARMWVGANGSGKYDTFWDPGTAVSSTPTTEPVFGDTVEYRTVLSASGTVQGHISVNAATEVSGAESAAQALPVTFSAERFYINSVGTANSGLLAVLDIKISRGVKTLAQMRAL